MNNKNLVINRLLILPLSLLAYFLIFLVIPIIICWFLDNITFNLFDNLSMNIARIVSSLIAGYLFVIVGVKLEPTHKNKVALIMTLLILVKLLVFGYLSIVGKEFFILFLNILELFSGFVAYKATIHNDEK